MLCLSFSCKRNNGTFLRVTCISFNHCQPPRSPKPTPSVEEETWSPAEFVVYECEGVDKDEPQHPRVARG